MTASADRAVRREDPRTRCRAGERRTLRVAALRRSLRLILAAADPRDAACARRLSWYALLLALAVPGVAGPAAAAQPPASPASVRHAAPGAIGCDGDEGADDDDDEDDDEDEDGGGEDRAHVAVVRGDDDDGDEDDDGGDEDAPPQISPELFGIRFWIDASTDGFEDGQMPVSIEAACGAPRPLEPRLRRLSEVDGALVVTPRTRVWLEGRRLSGARAAAALDDADTVSAKVKLLREGRWAADEDGNAVPTFRAYRVLVTD